VTKRRNSSIATSATRSKKENRPISYQKKGLPGSIWEGAGDHKTLAPPGGKREGGIQSAEEMRKRIHRQGFERSRGKGEVKKKPLGKGGTLQQKDVKNASESTEGVAHQMKPNEPCRLPAPKRCIKEQI